MARIISRRKQHFEKTIKSFLYSIFGTTMPFMLVVLIGFLLNKGEVAINFLDKGEVLLFAAGLYTVSIYLFGENKPSIEKTYDKILSNMTVYLLILTSASYTAIYIVKEFNFESVNLNICLIRIVSIVLFIVSAVAVYRSVYIDFKKIYPDVDITQISNDGVNEVLEQL